MDQIFYSLKQQQQQVTLIVGAEQEQKIQVFNYIVFFLLETSNDDIC